MVLVGAAPPTTTLCLVGYTRQGGWVRNGIQEYKTAMFFYK